MKVLCSSTPMEGVFAPFVPLGKALLAGPQRRRRHRPRPRTARAARRIRYGGGWTRRHGGGHGGDGRSGGGQRAGGEHWHFGAAMFGAVIAPAKLPALRQLADDYQPDLIVHAEVDVAAPLLAAERGLPSVTYGFAQPLDPNMLAALAERVAPLWRSAGLNPDPYAGIYRDRYLDPCPASLQGERGPAAAAAEPIRPEVPGDPAASLPDWAATLGGRPVVYLSLGTVRLFNQPTSSRRSWPTSPTRTWTSSSPSAS